MIFVYKEDLLRVLQLLQDEMQRNFVHTLITPATTYRMQATLDALIRRYSLGENNPIWQIKFEIVYTGPGSFELRPNLDDVTLLSRKYPVPK